MKRIELQCVDKRYREEIWTLEIEDGSATLSDGDGRTRATIDGAKAEGRFILPSFWRSVKNIGIVADRIDGKELIWFYPDFRALASIGKFISLGLAARGPTTIRAMNRNGWALTVGGYGLFVGGFALIVMSLSRAYDAPELFVRLSLVAMPLGLAMSWLGILKVGKSSRAARILRRKEAGSP